VKAEQRKLAGKGVFQIKHFVFFAASAAFLKAQLYVECKYLTGEKTL
jgi:hypothetical protein